jgi:penicillin-binding protein 1A
MIARYYKGRSAGAWNPPEDVVAVQLDRATGQPPTELTPPDRIYTEYFLAGTEPGAVRLDPWSIFSRGPITW